ncbi:MAG: FAD-dependent oxidoreductase [Holophaga sp.]|nr:FAD-dependent oxidoreductase [Holophaga sp.]
MSKQMELADAEYDLVIIGGGGSGKSAALTAAQAGLNVAILEKLPETGGTSCFAEGTAAFESSEQKARRSPSDPTRHFPTRAEGYRCFMDSSHERANPDVVRMFVNNSAETIDVMKSLGVVYTDVDIYAYDQPNELVTFHRPDGLGARVQELLLRACVNAGVDIFTATPAREIAMKDGAVAGVLATDSDGNTMHIACKAVILASGGYANSPEVRKQYSWLSRTTDYMYTPVPTQNTGDGLKMAIAAGGDLENIGALMIGPGAPGKTMNSHVGGAGAQPVLWVNKDAQRFIGEDVALSFAKVGCAFAKQPEGKVFAIFDGEQVRHLVEEGSDIGLGDFIPYHGKLNHLEAELAQDVADGTAWRAETIQGLAKLISLDPEALARTVTEYNAACDSGSDPLFFKPAQYLRPVRTAPFHAVRMAPTLLVSDGGIRVNGNLQVTDRDYKPIPGLYAVGNDASGLYGDSYNLDVPGCANSFAHTSGRVAARHAIQSIQDQQTV